MSFTKNLLNSLQEKGVEVKVDAGSKLPASTAKDSYTKNFLTALQKRLSDSSTEGTEEKNAAFSPREKKTVGDILENAVTNAMYTEAPKRSFTELADEAEQVYQSYVSSDAYKQKREAYMQDAASRGVDPYAFIGLAFNYVDQTEQELKTRADYYRTQAQQEADNAVMVRDMNEFKTWSPTDQAALMRYVAENNAEPFVGEPTFQNAWYNAQELIDKYGAQKVMEMAESYRRSKNQEISETVEKLTNEAPYSDPSTFGEKMANNLLSPNGDGTFWGKLSAGTLHSALSVGANLANSLTSPVGYLQEMTGRTGRYSTLDPNNAGNVFSQYAGNVRQKVAENIAGDEFNSKLGVQTKDGGFGRQAGATFYEAFMSAVDSGARLLFAKGNKKVSLGLAATGSFGQTVSKLSSQGVDPARAVGMGIIDGALEIATEKWSLDNLLKEAKAGPKNIKEILLNVLKQGGIEVSEEEASLLGSTFAEAAILQEKSSYNQQVGQLMAQGKGYAQARNEAGMALVREAGETMVQAFLSGGMSAGATDAFINVADKLSSRGKPKQNIRQENESMILKDGEVEGVSLPTSGVSVETTDRVKQKFIDQAGRLSRATGREIVFYSADRTANGIENGYFADGKIYVNTRSENAVAQIVSHELTHSVEFADAYQDLSKVVFDQIRNMGADVESLRQQKAALYAENGHALKDMTAVDQEIVADFVEQYLLTDEQTILDVAAQNRSLGQRIMSWIDNLLAKLGNKDAQERTFLNNARNLWAKALEQSQNGKDIKSETNSNSLIADGIEETKAWANEMYQSGKWTDAEWEAFYDEYIEPEINYETGEEQFSFAGTNARTADFQTLVNAQMMDKQGIDNETIRQQTGWFKGMDGKWRFEIDDSGMKYHKMGDAQFSKDHEGYRRYRELERKFIDATITDSELSEMAELRNTWANEAPRLRQMVVRGNAKLYHVLAHDVLFEQYPQLRDTGVRFGDTDDVGGWWDRERNEIVLSNRYRHADSAFLERTLLHEIQHAIQDIEGFANGANPEYWDNIQNSERAIRENDAKIAKAEREAKDALKGIPPEVAKDFWYAANMREVDPEGAERLENELLEGEYSDAYSDYSWAIWTLQELMEQENPKRTAKDLYRNTAGEIEARDTANRLDLDAKARKNRLPNTGDERTVFAEGNGISADYIGKTSDGIEVYETSDAVKNLSWKERKKLFLNLMNNQYRGRTAKFVRNGHPYYAKFAYGDVNKNIYGDNKSDDNGRDAKINVGADGSIFELVEQAEYWRSEPESGKNSKMHRGVNYWDYFVKTVQVDGKVFDLIANVRKKSDSEYVYAIEMHENKEIEPSSPEGPQQSVLNGVPNSSINSIEDNDQNVKQYSINATDKRGIASDLRSILSRGGSTAELRQYIDHLERGDRNTERTKGGTYQKGVSAKQSGPQRIIQEARKQGIGVEEYLQLNWEQYDVDGEWNEDARAALDQERRGRRYSISGTGEQTREDTEKKTAQQIREEMPAKARNHLEGQERKLLKNLSEDLGVSKFQKQNVLQRLIREISDEYLVEGRLTEEKRDFIFDKAYANKIEQDANYYNTYKNVQHYLHTSGVTISKEDQKKFFNYTWFKGKAAETLRIVNNGIPVDSAYHELHEMAPELFPESITHPADQLMRMYEVGQSIRVAEVSLQHFYGEHADIFRQDAKNKFGDAINEAVSELRNVRRVAEEAAEKKAEKEAEKAAVPATPEEAAEAYQQLKAARKTYEKALAKNLLSDHDEMQVGRLLRGEILPEHLNPDKDNVKAIMAVYEPKQEYERLTKRIAEYKKTVKAAKLQKADNLLETATDWKDKKVGIAYSRETMERNIYDIVPDKAVAEQIIREIFNPVHISEAEATRFKNEYRDKVRALDLSRKVMKGNLVSEAHAVQLLGEAEDNIRVLQNSRGHMKKRDGKTIEEWQDVIDEMWRQSPDLNEQKIRRAVAEFRKIYDELFQKMNEVRVRNGYEPVNYRQGYFPHFQPGDGDGVMAFFGKALGIDTQVAALPTTINGLTHTFRPGIQWFGNAQERLGFNTAYDAVEGFDKYIEGVASVIYQTDNIQMLRAMESQIRYRTTDEGIRKQVDAVNADSRLTEEEKRIKINDIYEHGKYTLSNFVTELTEYTNLLANKKSRLDRTMESMFGRKSYTVVKAWESRVGANMISGNISSALTNIIPLTQAWGHLNSTSMLRGMGATLKAYKQDDGLTGVSTFLTNRRGSDPLIKAWENDYGFAELLADSFLPQKIKSKEGYQTVKRGIKKMYAPVKPVVGWASEKSNVLMELVDGFVSESIVRAAYFQNRDQGLSETEAMYQADKLAASVMADRSKGAMPTLFESTNPFIKLFTQFQLEVNNQFSEVFKDLPRKYKERGLKVMTFALFKYFIGAFLFNELFEFFTGRRPALDPIDMLLNAAADLNTEEWYDEETESIDGDAIRAGIGEAGKNLAGAALSELPFSSGLTLLGIETDGGRVPASSAVPDLTALWDAATKEDWSAEKRWKEAQDELNKLAYIIPPFGGNQIQKIWKGVKAYNEGGSYNVDAEGNDILQYPVYNDEPGDFWNLVRATIMGKSSLDTAQDWVESGFDSLGAKQTAVYQDMLDAGTTGKAAYSLLMAIQDAEKTDTESRARIQRSILQNADVSDEAKAIVYYGILASDSNRDIMDDLADQGADAGEVGKVLMAIQDASELKGAEGSCARRDAIADSALTDEEKIVIYRAKISESRDDDIASFRAAGMSFDEFLKVQNQYAKIDEKDIGATMKATELSRWVDGQNYSQKQEEVIVECFKYWYQTPATADRYDNLVDAGLNMNDAFELAGEISELEPEEGETTVSDVQKWRQCVNFSSNTEIQLAALRGVITEDNRFEKIQIAFDFGVEPETYVQYYEVRAQYDTDGNGSYTNAEVTAAVNSIKGLNTAQRAALWQIVSGNKSAKNNPYSREVGQKVLDAKAAAKERAESEEEEETFSDAVMKQLLNRK